jgi:hypothetical protein
MGWVSGVCAQQEELTRLRLVKENKQLVSHGGYLKLRDAST